MTSLSEILLTISSSLVSSGSESDVRTKQLQTQITQVASETELVAVAKQALTLCKTLTSAIKEAKNSGAIVSPGVKKQYSIGLAGNLDLAQSLSDKLSSIKDAGRATDVGHIIIGILLLVAEVVDQVPGNGKIAVTEKAKSFGLKSAKSGIDISSGGADAASSVTSASDDWFANVLAITQRHDFSRQIWELIVQWNQERDALIERAGEQRQADRLEEARLQDQREDERVEERSRADREEEASLAVTAYQYCQDLAISYFDRVDAEVRSNLAEIELRHVQAQRGNSPLV